MLLSTEGSERKARDVCTNNGSIKDDIWRTRHKNELYKFYYEQDIVQAIKIERLRCLDTSSETKNWVLAESLLFLNQKAIYV